MSVLDWMLATFGVALQLMVFHQFARGWWRRFPLLFLYLAVLVLLSVLQTAAIIDDNGWTPATERLYWYSTAIARSLLYFSILHLIWQIAHSSAGARLVARLAIGSVALSLCSLYWHSGKHLNLFLTEVSRDISFLGLILNLFLWTVLLRRKDRLLLALSSALGMQMACEASGHALRQMGPAAVPYGDFLVVVGELLMLTLWWLAFRRSPLTVSPAADKQAKTPAEAASPS